MPTTKVHSNRHNHYVSWHNSYHWRSCSIQCLRCSDRTTFSPSLQKLDGSFKLVCSNEEECNSNLPFFSSWSISTSPQLTDAVTFTPTGWSEEAQVCSTSPLVSIARLVLDDWAMCVDWWGGRFADVVCLSLPLR